MDRETTLLIGAQPLLAAAWAPAGSLSWAGLAECTYLRSVARSMDEYAAARVLYERCLSAREAALGPAHPLVAATLRNLGMLLESQQQLKQALPLFERSLSIWEAACGRDSLEAGRALNNLGMLHCAMGHLDEALPLYERRRADAPHGCTGAPPVGTAPFSRIGLW